MTGDAVAPWWRLVPLTRGGRARADLVLRGGRVWAGKGLPAATAVARHGRPRDRGGQRRRRRASDRPRHPRGRAARPAGGPRLQRRPRAFPERRLRPPLRGPARREGRGGFRAAIGEYARTLPKGTWIQEGNWDHEVWPSKALPTRQLIDAVTPDHPGIRPAAGRAHGSGQFAGPPAGRDHARDAGPGGRHDRARRRWRAHRHPQGQRRSSSRARSPSRRGR